MEQYRYIIIGSLDGIDDLFEDLDLTFSGDINLKTDVVRFIAADRDAAESCLLLLQQKYPDYEFQLFEPSAHSRAAASDPTVFSLDYYPPHPSAQL